MISIFFLLLLLLYKRVSILNADYYCKAFLKFPPGKFFFSCFFFLVANSKATDFWNSVAGPLGDEGFVDLFVNPKITITCIIVNGNKRY